MKYDHRPWVSYYVLDDAKTHKVKRIEVKPAGRLSYQYHHKRSEVWTMVSGKARVTLDGKKIDLDAGDVIEIPKLFLFSSRRRHTRLTCDWSSDVCSSDLGANALELSAKVRDAMEKLKSNFPSGVDYSVVYDPTVFVRHSIEAVVHTLLEAILLVRSEERRVGKECRGGVGAGGG